MQLQRSGALAQLKQVDAILRSVTSIENGTLSVPLALARYWDAFDRVQTTATALALSVDQLREGASSPLQSPTVTSRRGLAALSDGGRDQVIPAIEKNGDTGVVEGHDRQLGDDDGTTCRRDLAYHNATVRRLVAEGLLNEALIAARTFVSDCPSCPDSHATLATVLQHHKQYANAAEEFRHAIRLGGSQTPTREQALLQFQLAWCSYEIGDDPGAIDGFIKATKLEPGYGVDITSIIVCPLRPRRPTSWNEDPAAIERARSVCHTIELASAALGHLLLEGPLPSRFNGLSHIVDAEHASRRWWITLSRWTTLIGQIPQLGLAAINWESVETKGDAPVRVGDGI